MARLVIAIGGNAISSPAMPMRGGAPKFKGLDSIAAEIVKLYMKGNEIVVTHGNGPQVGIELERNETADRTIPELPLYLLTAETQSVIGSSIAMGIRNSAFAGKPEVCTILTHVLVDENDPGFKNPVKPIGPFMNRRNILSAGNQAGLSHIKFERGFRLVVPSPEPKSVIEINNIISLSKQGIVVACGGGGIPVVMHREGYRGVDAVVDKDLCSSLLAVEMGADALIILTDVDYVYSDYPNRSGRIKNVNAHVLERNIMRFETGTMMPKIKACIDFVKATRKPAYIGSVLKLGDIINGRSGTKITAIS